jgi:hypothetical protein
VVDGGSNFDTAEIPANSATFAYNLLAGEQLTCDWYMVLSEQGNGQQQEQSNQQSQQSEDVQQDEPNQQSEEEFQQVQPGQSEEPSQQSNSGDVTITLNERLCPQGYDLKGVDAATIANDCTQTSNGVLFVLIDPELKALTQQSGSFADGAVSWDAIAAGQVLITEPLPGGVAGQHAAFCSIAPQGENDSSHFEKMSIVNGTIHATVNGGETLTCNWYDVG